MAQDPIPSPDDQFTPFAATFMAWITPNGTAHGLTSGQISEITGYSDTWGPTLASFHAAETAFHSATQDKDATRAPFEAMIRELMAILQKNPNTTDPDRVAFGGTVPKGTRTPVPPPSTTPLATEISAPERGVLSILLADSATPLKRSKPAGAVSADTRQQIGGTAPTDPAMMPALPPATRSPYRVQYDNADVGKTVYLAFRWLNGKGEAGPWSQIYTAVIPS